MKKKYSDFSVSCYLFSGKTAEEIDSILEKTDCFVKRYVSGESVFNSEDSTEYFGIILKGSLNVKKNLESGRGYTIFHRKSGDLFGGGVAFSRNPSFPCDIYSQGETEILYINKKSVYEILCKDSVIAENLISLFSKEVLVFERKLELFSTSSIRKKIAFSLLYDDYAVLEKFRLPYSKTEWAELLNVSRPSLCREIKKLHECGIIEMDGKNIRIIDRSGLGKIISE